MPMRKKWRPSYYPMGVEPGYPPMIPNSIEEVRNAIDLYTDILEAFEKKAKEKGEEKKKDDKPKPKQYSVLEVLGMVTILGPFIVGIEFWFFTQILAGLATGK